MITAELQPRQPEHRVKTGESKDIAPEALAAVRAQFEGSMTPDRAKAQLTQMQKDIAEIKTVAQEILLQKSA